MKKLIVFFGLLFACSKLLAQYTENGSAASTNCHCYVLTPNVLNESGSVWNNNKIDLRLNFDYQFNVFLGCTDAGGADGIVFALQPISTSVGSTGGGMGFQGITPSVGVTLDTYQNIEYNDPVYDHIDIQYDGNLTHTGVPPRISATSDNVEDCIWHTLRVTWNATSKTYAAYFDGQLRISTVNDIVKNIFGGDPMVFWGFTGSTGGASNLQQFCTALNPAFNFTTNQKRCIGDSITFYDSTISFAPLSKRYWDFGDGSPIDSIHINPVHTYIVAGDYTVLQTVIGIDGCSEINKKTLRIGSIPVAAFGMNNACADSSVNFKDLSTEQVGTINQWNWNLGSGVSSTLQNPVHTYPFYSGQGPFAISLSVKTLEGCSSDTATNYLKIFPRPIANFISSASACSNTAVNFTDSSYLDLSGNTFNSSINNWAWNFGNGQVSSAQNTNTSFSTTGNTTISLVVKTDSGCASLPVTKAITILSKPTAYFTTGAVCASANTIFTDSSFTNNGDSVNNWWWNLGNGAIATVPNTSATYTAAGEVTVQLVVSDKNNCVSDTLKKVITVQSKPLAQFGIGLPVCENDILQFLDSSVTQGGIIQNWSWKFDNGDSSVLKNSTTQFSAGNHTVKLLVKNSGGCTSEVLSKVIFVNPLPAFDFNFAAACKNAVVNFSAADNSGGTINQWKWDLGDGTTATTKNTQHTYKNTATYPIQLLAISVAGCTATKDSSLIIYGTNVFAGNDTVAAPNQPIQLQASGGLSYQWSPATGLSDAGISNPVATNAVSQTYYLKASTPLGCETFDTINIKVYDGPQLYLPTAFTPNGDGLNDVFRVFPVGITHFDYFAIYNRYGKIIFYTKNEGEGWDGSFQNNPQNPGTYVWTISGADYKGNKITRKGTVVLIR